MYFITFHFSALNLMLIELNIVAMKEQWCKGMGLIRLRLRRLESF